MASDLNAELSKNTVIFGLKVWEVIGIIHYCRFITIRGFSWGVLAIRSLQSWSSILVVEVYLLLCCASLSSKQHLSTLKSFYKVNGQQSGKKTGRMESQFAAWEKQQEEIEQTKDLMRRSSFPERGRSGQSVVAIKNLEFDYEDQALDLNITLAEAAESWKLDNIKRLLDRGNFKADVLDRKAYVLSGGEKVNAHGMSYLFLGMFIFQILST
ncbi:ABC transporter F family member 5 [Olea europaea subsp. europaea]|uniref:ABC transporter F family member 5 n=1 Tax=Olea europaea subsp. europaea TaxID=158383 RepID=A0A8S0QCR0_OLEEU|nr:ABC transporter F family member 5 [Olea europaea subsp. europaea]